MKTWKQISKHYEHYLNSKNLANPNIRLSRLPKIEQYLNDLYPAIMKGTVNFLHLDKAQLKQGYQRWKGKNINGAESQLFNDFYNIGSTKSR